MKAVRIHSYGGTDTLVYEEVARPTPGEGQVLINVKAAGVNPLDVKIRAGYMQGMMNFPLPLILGVDLAGVVAEVGPGVVGFETGDEVYGLGNMAVSGTYAEYAVVEPESISLKPKTLDFVQAASVPVVAMTAWQSLFDFGGLSEGQTVLIHAAAGGVGLFAVQLAKWKGARVIGTASGKNLDFVRELGADEVIDYKTTAFEDVINDVDVVLDTIGGDTRERSFGVLKKGGIIISTTSPPSQETAEHLGVRAAMVMVKSNQSLLKEIAELLDTGKIKTVVETVLPLAEVRQAHEISESGHGRGKIVLEV